MTRHIGQFLPTHSDHPQGHIFPQQPQLLPNGWTTDHTYNAVGMMTSLANKKSNGSALTSLGSTSYDGAFNLTGMTATYSFPTSYGGASTWTYDDKDQLTNETSARNGGWNHTNEYDDAGNPTKFKNNTRTYNSDNQLTTGSMTYDGNGNPTTYAGATLTYDENNRVTSIGSLLTCGYRADGQRAWKQGSTGGKTYFLYDQGNPIVEMNSSGTVTATNVYAPDGLVGRKEGSNAWAYYTFDMQGNVAQKLSPSEAVTSGRVVDAWGTGQATVTPYSPDCFGYNAKWGYYYDTQTGLYLCQHRMYDASTGRWLNRDPIGYSGGINLYGYCGNGAVGGVDSSGWLLSSLTTPSGVATLALFEDELGTGLALEGMGIEMALDGAQAILGPRRDLDPKRSCLSDLALSTVGDLSEGPVLPKNPAGLDALLGVSGRAVPDHPSTPGRNQTRWDLDDGSYFVHENHSYDPYNPAYSPEQNARHRDWHYE